MKAIPQRQHPHCPPPPKAPVSIHRGGRFLIPTHLNKKGENPMLFDMLKWLAKEWWLWLAIFIFWAMTNLVF